MDSKKARIIRAWDDGVTDVEAICSRTGAKPSYAAAVLQAAGKLDGYFDLYTNTSRTMNVYSKRFDGKLGYRNVEAAHRSVALIDEVYWELGEAHDRAGQHHAMAEALVMFDRARWSHKLDEADVFRTWLLERLLDDLPVAA